MRVTDCCLGDRSCGLLTGLQCLGGQRNTAIREYLAGGAASGGWAIRIATNAQYRLCVCLDECAHPASRPAYVRCGRFAGDHATGGVSAEAERTGAGRRRGPFENLDFTGPADIWDKVPSTDARSTRMPVCVDERHSYMREGVYSIFAISRLCCSSKRNVFVCTLLSSLVLAPLTFGVLLISCILVAPISHR